MVGLRILINLPVLMTLILAVIGGKNRRLYARYDQHGGNGGGYQFPCTNDPNMYQYFPPCSAAATPTVASVTTSASMTTTAADPSALDRAQWCRLSNGTYLPLGYTYSSTPCTLCQCSQSRSILCSTLRCMPTYCIDDSKPIRKTDQCCPQCADDPEINTSCLYNTISFPHGTILKSVQNKTTCWCQLGNIECRNYMASLLIAATDKTF